MLSEMNLASRLDSGFAVFPERKYLEKILSSKKTKSISEISKYISSGHTPYLHNLKEGDTDFITVECISDLTLHQNKFKKISLAQFEKEFKKNHLQPGSVLCTIKRRICKAFPVTKDYGNIAFNQDVAIIIPNDEVSPVYLATYLCSNVGQLFANKQMTEQINPYISVENLSVLPVVITSKAFQNQIDALFEKADTYRTKSIKKYSSAERLLSDELGISDIPTNMKSINIKEIKDSFSITGRLDAEYYQPKYDEYQNRVLDYPNGWLPLSQACEIKDNNFTPDNDPIYKYIELSDIDSLGNINNWTEARGNDLPSRARRKVNTNDVLISSIEGSLSSCAIISSLMDNALCSTGFYVISSVKINPETLLVLFKSPLLQNLLKQGCSGTILSAINKTELQKIPIPIIGNSVQRKIEVLIKESSSLRLESERLLKVAKHAVEIAVEQDEKASITYVREYS